MHEINIYKTCCTLIIAAHLFPGFAQSSDRVFIHQTSFEVHIFHLPAKQQTNTMLLLIIHKASSGLTISGAAQETSTFS